MRDNDDFMSFLVQFQAENSTEIIVSVRSDPTPEIEERYTLNLVAITTLSDFISPSGAAVFDQQGRTSSITIRASDNPHGVVQFQQSSLSARSQDGSVVEFTIIREFGTFGELTQNETADYLKLDLWCLAGANEPNVGALLKSSTNYVARIDLHTKVVSSGYKL